MDFTQRNFAFSFVINRLASTSHMAVLLIQPYTDCFMLGAF